MCIPPRICRTSISLQYLAPIVLFKTLLPLRTVVVIAAALLASGAQGHDIPDEVRVQAFLKPEGRTLKLLARVPLKAMRDVDVPRRSGGFLDFRRVDSALREAATIWLAQEIEL